MSTIGKRIKEMRKRHHWTQRVLALKLADVAPPGFAITTIGNWEQDRNKPSERAIWALERAFGEQLRK